MKRTLSLILVLAMAFSLMLGVIPSAEEATGELEISQASVKFGDVVYLYVAVDYSAVGSAEGITLQITNNKTAAVTTLSPDDSIEVKEGCVAFKYTDLGAKNMGDELTLQALKDDVANGEAKTFSILEYAIKAQGEGDENLTNLVNAMIAYGAAAQGAYDYEGSYDLTKEYGLVVVNGSAEGKAIAEVGSTATFTPDVAGATLYDMTLTAIDAITVPAGTSRFFYISDAQKTPVNFDFTTAAIADKELTTATDTRIGYNYYSDKVNTGSETKLGAETTIGNLFPDLFKFPIAFGAVSGANGYLKLYSTGGSVYLKENNGDVHINAAGASVFTIAVTLGREGLTDFLGGTFALGPGNNNLGAFKAVNTGDSTEFRAIIGTSLERDENGNHITLCTLDGEEGANKFITIYIVVDMATGTYTFYNSQNGKVHSNTGTSNIGTSGYASGNRDRVTYLEKYFGGGTNSQSFIYTSTGTGTLLLQKCKFFFGNIFE